MSSRIDHGGKCALRKIGNPEGFSVCAWEALDDGVTVYRMKREIRCEPGARRMWTGDERTASVNSDELRQEEARYEAEQGKCAKCGGSGREWAGWNVNTGDHYRQCDRCWGTGKPPQKHEEAAK